MRNWNQVRLMVPRHFPPVREVVGHTVPAVLVPPPRAEVVEPAHRHWNHLAVLKGKMARPLVEMAGSVRHGNQPVLTEGQWPRVIDHRRLTQQTGLVPGLAEKGFGYAPRWHHRECPTSHLAAHLRTAHLPRVAALQHVEQRLPTAVVGSASELCFPLLVHLGRVTLIQVID